MKSRTTRRTSVAAWRRWITRIPPVRVSLLGMALVSLLLEVHAAELSAVAPGTRAMVEQIEKAIQQTDPRRSDFRSREKAELLRQSLVGRPKTPELIPLQFALGSLLIQSGQNQAALAALQQVEDLSRELKQPLSVTNEINLRLNQALAWLREGELRNCLSNHSSQSCLLPIEGGGRHRWQEGSQTAMKILESLLTEHPDNLPARWILNIAAMTVGEYPAGVPERWRISPKVFESEYDIGRFAQVAEPAGVADEAISGGAAVDDFDGDGFLDIVTTSSGIRDPMRFFHNNGDGTFSDRSREAGLTGLTGGLNIVTTDFNNDGYTDVMVLRGGWQREEGRFPNSLLRNNGNGTFEDVTIAAGMLSFHPGQTAAWFDFDGDGWLDVFVGNETAAGEPRHSCELYRNNHDGTFTNIASAAGLRINAYVKGVTAGDFNNDGRPDLYLSILGRPNQLFRNDGPATGPEAGRIWKFTEVGAAAGVQEPLFSFPTWFFDYDNDGNEDLFVSGYRIQDVGDVAADVLGLPSPGEHLRLFRNRGDGTFADVTREAHLHRVVHSMGSNFGDLDNDGWPDFYLGTGNPDLLTLIPNRMFRNADGTFFQDVTTSGGFGHLQKGHAICFADLDNDGDQDVYADMGGAYPGDRAPNILFANPGHGNHWLKLQLVGVKANRPGLGARLTLKWSGPSGERVLHRTVSTGGSFGANPLRQEIGLADARAIHSLEIHWPGSGTVQVIRDLEPDRFYRVTEGRERAEVVPLKSCVLPLPKDHAAHEAGRSPE